MRKVFCGHFLIQWLPTATKKRFAAAIDCLRSHSDARLSSLLEIESDFSITNVFLEISFA